MRKTVFFLGASLVLFIVAPCSADEKPVLGFKQRKSQEPAFRDVTGTVLDIRGTLKIIIDKDRLRSIVAQRQGNIDQVRNALKFFVDLMRKREEAIAGIQEAMELSKNVSEADPGLLIQKVQKAAAHAAMILDEKYLDELFGPELAREIQQSYYALLSHLPDEDAGNPVTQYALAFKVAAKYAAKFSKDLDELIKAEGVYIQLGAWLDNKDERRALHLAGFDNNPVPSPYDPNPWKIDIGRLSEEYKNAAQFADTLNKEKTLADAIKQSSNALIGKVYLSLSNSLKGCNTLSAEWGNLSKAVGASAQRLKTDYEELQKEISRLRTDYDPKGPINRFTPDELLIKAFGDYSSFSRLVIQFEKDLKAGIEKLSSAQKTLSDSANQCYSESINLLRSVMTAFNPAGSVRGIGSAFLSEGYAFTDKATKLDVQNLPDQAILSMTDTGYREPGDSLFVKLGVGKGGEEAQETDSRFFHLEHTSWHVDTKVSIIFADPEGGLPSGKKWHFAPSYSLLLKFPSESVFYRRILDFGIGINVSALDFNGDGSVELGIAPAFSLFKDYLQAGYGYNIPEDEWYFFLGVSLPLPSQTIGDSEK